MFAAASSLSRPGRGPTALTDPDHPGHVWIFHAHPDLGRTVLLYEAGPNGTGAWHAPDTRPLVPRAGGYWWDDTGWFCPPQLWDAATGSPEEQGVPAAATRAASALLSDASHGTLHQVADLVEQGAAARAGWWLNDLARWAAHRTTVSGRPPLERRMISTPSPPPPAAPVPFRPRPSPTVAGRVRPLRTR